MSWVLPIKVITSTITLNHISRSKSYGTHRESIRSKKSKPILDFLSRTEKVACYG